MSSTIEKMAFSPGKILVGGIAGLLLLAGAAAAIFPCLPSADADDVLVRTCVAQRLVRMLGAKRDPVIVEITVHDDIAKYLPEQLSYDATLLKKLQRPIKFNSIRVALDRGIMHGPGPIHHNLDVKLADYLVPDQLYTYVITNDHVIVALTGPNIALNNLSKHAMLAQGKPVRMAGELWIDAKGTLHLNNASGTYVPKPALLEPTAKFMREHFKLQEVVLHPSH